jgi:hypothetical protein
MAMAYAVHTRGVEVTHMNNVITLRRDFDGWRVTLETGEEVLSPFSARVPFDAVREAIAKLNPGFRVTLAERAEGSK